MADYVRVFYIGVIIYPCPNISADLANTCNAVSVYHYSGVIMSVMTSQITGVSIVCSTVCSGADQRKYQSPASLAVVRLIQRCPVVYPHKGPVTRKMFLFDDVIMYIPQNMSVTSPVNHDQ